MAGPFAHITLVDSLCGDALESISTLTSPMRYALRMFNKFCELGAVSPDCPYLMAQDSATGWANVMHYYRTGDFIRTGIEHLTDLKPENPQTLRCYAWLFGYTAHVVTDLTIHPVVQKLVGPYAQHKKEHRLCEINQDIYVFYEYKHKQLTEAQFLKACGIADCCDENDTQKLNVAVSELWNSCLESFPIEEIEMDVAGPTGAPEIDRWFKTYVFMINDCAAKGIKLPFKSIIEGTGYIYPDITELDRAYIDNLQTPSGEIIQYDQLFDRAKANVTQYWSDL